MSSSKSFYFWFFAVISMTRFEISELITVSNKEYAVTYIQEEHLTFEWKIKNYTRLPQKHGECIQSLNFHTERDDLQLFMRFCPRGWGSDNIHHASLYLYTDSPNGKEVTAKIDGILSILKSEKVIGEEKFANTSVDNSGFGYKHMAIISDLLSPSHSDDDVTIRCEIDMPPKLITKLMNEPLEQEASRDLGKGSLNEDFGLLLKGAKFSDVVLHVGDERLLAHKSILTIRSPVFADLFEHAEMDDAGKSLVKIDKTEPAVMTAVLEYLYTDHVSNLGELSLTYGLVAAADDFKLPHLKTICENVLHKRLDADTAADILVLADRYGLSKLKKLAMEFIKNHFSEVMETESYKKVKNESPALLMEILFTANDKHF